MQAGLGGGFDSRQIRFLLSGFMPKPIFKVPQFTEFTGLLPLLLLSPATSFYKLNRKEKVRETQ
jgi:hypothetical protein